MDKVTIKNKIMVFVLAKNEEANISRCLDSLSQNGIAVKVFDSGSTDKTAIIATSYSSVEVVPHKYIDHCATCNEITTSQIEDYEYAMILDADMCVSREMIQEITGLIEDRQVEVIKSPIQMFVEGKMLKTGSLCPPKAILFKFGRAYFIPSGHGESLVNDCFIIHTKTCLLHDDRKIYEAYLMSQIRYAQNLWLRSKKGAVGVKDILRLNTPTMLFIVPFVSLFFKLGLLSGKIGLIYAIDRLIAEAIMFRYSLSKNI